MTIRFVVDQRSPNRVALQDALDKILLYEGQYILQTFSYNQTVLITDISVSGYFGVPEGLTHIDTAAYFRDHSFNFLPGDWDFTGHGVGSKADLVGSGTADNDEITAVLAIESDIVVNGSPISTFNGAGNSTLERVIFHELIHLNFNHINYTTTHGGVDLNLSEELVAFAENIYYVAMSSSTNPDHTSLRYGHDVTPWTGGTSTPYNGVAPFVAYSGILPALSEDADGFIFTVSTPNGSSILSKSYKVPGFAPGLATDGFTYDHYIRLAETTQATALSVTGSAVTNTNRLIEIMQSIQSNASLNVLNDAKAAISIVGSGSYSVNTVVGLAKDAYHDLGTTSYGVNVSTTYLGVTSHGDDPEQAKIVIDERASTSSTLILGAAGDKNWNGDLLRGSEVSTNILISTGLGNNELYGGQMDDILVGNTGNDKLFGVYGNDIFIPGRGTNEVHANGGTVYYGDEAQGIRVEGRNVTHDGGNYTRAIDIVEGVTSYIGSASDDVFVGIGGKTYYGNGGIDTFFAVDSADRFFGVGGIISGTISYANLTATDTRINEYSTSLGHVTHRPNILIGSDQRDYIEASRAEIHGGGGNDVIKTGLRDAYGDEGDDTFIPQSGTYAVTLHGGIGNDIINLPSLVGVAPGHYWYLDWRSPSYHAFGYIDGSFGLTTHYTLDSIEGYTYDPTLVAVNILLPTAIANTFTGTDYNDVITGGDLGDTLRAGGAYGFVSVANVINGGGGNDTIYGATNGGSTYNGDRLDGGADNDTIWGGASKDTILGGQGGDYLHGGGGNDNFYDELGTNYIYGDAGTDVLHLEGWRTSDLNFGTAGTGWRYVSAKNGAFIDYITTVEQIVTMNGTVNVTYAANGFRGGADHGDAPAFSSTDSDGFDFSGFEAVNGPEDNLMAEKLSFTGEGVFNVDSDWTETSDQIQAHGLENMALNMDMMPIHLMQPALADYGFLI